MKMLIAFVVAIIACPCHVNRTQFTSAQIQTVPLWDTNSTVQMCHVEHLQDGMVNFQGNPYYGCNLQVLASSNTFLVIEMPAGREDSGVFFYVERMDHFIECPKKYVLIEGELKGCSVAFMGIHLTLILYGNVNVSVSGITRREELQLECPEFAANADARLHLNDFCQSVQGYDQQITCYNQDQYLNGECKISFAPSCSSFLGYKEVRFECHGRESLHSQTTLVVIPPSMLILHLVDNGIVEIDVNAFQYLTNLRVLHLYYNPLVELPNYLFKGSTQLTNLYLSDNRLHTLHPRVFEGLENLEWLDLFNNQLSILPVDIFKGLKSLYNLRIWGNRLSSLGGSIYKGLQSLAELKLEVNKLLTLPLRIFEGLHNLRWLILHNNMLHTLPSGVFQGLTSLTELDLNSNELRELPVGLFQGLSNLSILQISRNKLVSLNEDLFHGLTNLFALTFYDNEILTLHLGAFEGLYNLKYLYLFNNKVHTLHYGIFQGLTVLTELDLKGNELRELPAELFHELSNLSILNIARNMLASLNQDNFQNLPNLFALNLAENNLHTLPSSVFASLEALEWLYLSYNRLASLLDDTFRDTKKLHYLDLGNNKLITLPSEIFRGLAQLERLPLNNNHLKSLNVSIFKDLKNVTFIDLGNNELTDITKLFQGLGHLKSLSLFNNSINSLQSAVFEDLINLKELNLNFNLLSVLPAELFYQLRNLEKLICTGNPLNTIHVDTFDGSRLPNLIHINLENNGLSYLPRGLFGEIRSLKQLFLSANKLESLAYDIFHGLVNITTLTLHVNEIEDLDERIFEDLINLSGLSLNNNKFKHLRRKIFKDLKNLERLHLSHNQLSDLDSNIFKDTVKLNYLELQNNKLTQLPNVNGLTQLSFLNIRSNVLTNIDTNSLKGLAENVQLFASQHEICDCYVSDDIICSASDRRSPYLTCDRLLSDRVLEALMWIIGVNALGGNIFVIVWRRKSPQKNKVQDFLLTNLAFSDFLMGVYMLIIASADVYFGQNFPMQSEAWRSGITCRVAGAISIISSEASVFFVTLISIDRFICIRFPFSMRKLTKRSVSLTAIFMWIFSLALGIVPSTLSGRNFKFYDNSHVCIGLPLALVERFATKETYRRIDFDGFYVNQFIFNTTPVGSARGLFFSSALFLGLNCLCYLIIFACYVEIVRSVLKSSKETHVNQEMKDQVRMAGKVAAIVTTDFCCWFPIILLGILVQTRILTLPASVFAWAVTFVLPINSAINPYLYTISAVISDRKQRNLKSQKNQASVSRAVVLSTKL